MDEGLTVKRVSIAAIAAVAALTFSQIAYSADMPTRAPAAPPVATYNWTGFYVGGNVGGGWGRHHGVNSFQANDPDTVFFFVSGGTPPPASFNSSGVIGGLQLGYNWQINRELLLGVETDFDWSGIKGSSITPYAPFGASGFVSSFDERIKWFGTVRGRLGYLPTDNLLAYVTAGFAYGRSSTPAISSITRSQLSLNRPLPATQVRHATLAPAAAPSADGRLAGGLNMPFGKGGRSRPNISM